MGAAAAVLSFPLTLGCAGAAGESEGDASTERVRQLYSAWERGQRLADRPETVRIALRHAKGITPSRPVMGGSVTLDLRSGAVEARVVGLTAEAELWLIDNQPGEGANTLPDAGDTAQLVGRLAPGEGVAQLVAELGSASMRGFDIDRVVLCESGRGPAEGILLTGSPSTFQRLYARSEVVASTGEGDPLEALVHRGRQLFEQETFGGNGRTCATCHPSNNNFTIDPRSIAQLPDDDPLFIAEQVPALAELENPLLMRSRGLILENLDGFDRPGVMRGVPHTLALPTSITGPAVPFDNTLNPDFGIVPPAERTGWSSDGAPGSGSLREFAMGAVIQHFPRRLAREPGVDFRLPTDEELDALELFQLSLGRAQDPEVSRLRFTDPVVREGMALFNRSDSEQGTQPAGKCGLCHNQASANIDSAFFSGLLGVPVSGNANFGTGVNDLGALPADLVDRPGNPRDGGFARVHHDGVNCIPERGGFGTVTPEGGALPPGLCEEDFNTPPLIEAADTAPFFHNNAVDTLEAAVAFYNDDAFNDSPGGQLLTAIDSGGIGIRLDTSQVTAVASFLRALNALENVRETRAQLREAWDARRSEARRLIDRARAEQRDALEVLESVGLHPDAVAALRRAGRAIECARDAHFRHSRRRSINEAIEALDAARALIVETA